MGLNKVMIDVPIGVLNQLPPEHQAPVGALSIAKNIIATKFTSNGSQTVADTGSRIKIQQRSAFIGFDTVTTDPSAGTSNSCTWSLPQLQSTLGQQLLAVCSSIPRVSQGIEEPWTGYKDKRIVANQLRSGVFHTGNHTIQAPSDAWLLGTTCSVWCETVSGASGVLSVKVMIGFRADNETWIVPPRVLYDPAQDVTDQINMARVRSDGVRFWVVYNYVDSFPKLKVLTFDEHGVAGPTSQILQNNTQPSVGYWDIISPEVNTLLLVQPENPPDGTTDVGVHFNTFTYNPIGPALDLTAAADTTVSCLGPVAWLTNDLDGLAYLGTWGLADSDPFIFAYIVEDNAQTHEYLVAPSPKEPDTIIGWPVVGPAPLQPTVHVSFTRLSDSTTPMPGPQNDPALRAVESWMTTFAGVTTKQRQNNSVIIVSRAFKHDGEYYALTYYQSGSGLAVTSTSQDVEITEGDYILGQANQPITVTSGVDKTHGSSKTYDTAASSLSIFTSFSQASFAIASPDKVELVFDNPAGGADQFLLKWTLSGLAPVFPSQTRGARLVIAGSSIATANATWDIVIADSGTTEIWTLPSNTIGGSLTPGTFSVAGGQTATIASMTAYKLPFLSQDYDTRTASMLIGGSLVVSGNATSANNGTKTTVRVVFSGDVTVDPYSLGTSIWITTGSESSSGGSFHAVVSPLLVQDWFFNDPVFDDALIQTGHTHKLSISGTAFEVAGNPAGQPGTPQNNDGDYLITDVIGAHTIQTDGTSITAQVFSGTLPTAAITRPVGEDQITFLFQSLTLDYTFQNATVVVSDAINPENDGAYTITQINDDGTFFAVPADGISDQRSEMFTSEDTTVTVFFSNNITPVFQPCWFMTPLEQQVKQAHVGRFEYLTAYADWRIEGDADLPHNMFLLSVTDPILTDTGVRFILPYRAQSFTASQPLVVATGQVVPAATTISQSTVGLKQFDLLNKYGTSVEQDQELLYPGAMAGRFTASGFTEDGVNIGPERPFVIEQTTTSEDLHLQAKTVHVYTVVAEVTDENSDRIYSIPSPALTVTMTGTNNSVLLGGRQIQALNSTGQAQFTDIYGLSNHKLVGMSLYRTSYKDNIPTTLRYKITDDLNINGIAPVSATNTSGFTWTSAFTWTYLDRNPDANILTGEVLYTDKGFLPRFPAPAYSHGIVWKDRTWVIGYDNAVWMSSERAEGDSAWYFPGFRFLFPDRPVQIQPMDEYMIVFMPKGKPWYIPAPSRFPDASGKNGDLPAPIQIATVSNGCTGVACPVRNGVSYIAEDGRCWVLTRDLRGLPMSLNILDELNASAVTVTSMVVDDDQRLNILTGTSTMFVYDQIVAAWYTWTLPMNASYGSVLDGRLAWLGTSRSALYTPGQYLDSMGNDTTSIIWDITLNSMGLGSFRGLKRVWAIQGLGTWKADHRLNIVVSYPDEPNTSPTVYQPYTPLSTGPYLFQFEPLIEEATNYVIRIYTDFVGVDVPGNSSELELLSIDAGFDRKPGISKTAALHVGNG